MPRHRTVLSIDGGGIRGIIPAVLIDYLERAVGKPASELFDLIAGTSTGGIIALGLGVPDPHSDQRPRYSGGDLAELYRARGAHIFSQTLWRRIHSVQGILDETYDAKPLEQALEDYFADTQLGSLRCRIMVTAYDIERRNTVFLKSFKPEHRDLSCMAAARATSAAPTYFTPAKLALGDQQHALIDGGVYINSPAVSAYAEALKLFPGDEITVVSLGTGELIRSIPESDASGWGRAGWVIPLLDCMFDGAAKAADHQMRLFLGEQYLRLQLSLKHASDDMDDASATNIDALFRSAEELIVEEQDQLQRLVAYLSGVHGTQVRPPDDLGPAVF